METVGEEIDYTKGEKQIGMKTTEEGQQVQFMLGR